MQLRVSLVTFVAMILVGIALGAPAAIPGGKGQILLVRHAERPPTTAPTGDPSLTDAGKARAERLAALVADKDVRAIFVTRFRRTQETAKPAAERLHLEPIVKSDTDDLIAALRAHGDETVLVVGHSDTLPDVVKAFGGPAITIADDAFDDFFVLSPATGELTRSKY